MLNAAYMESTAPPLRSPVAPNHTALCRVGLAFVAGPILAAAMSAADDTVYPIRPAAKGFGHSNNPAFAPTCATPRTMAPTSGQSIGQPTNRAREAFESHESTAIPTR